MSGLPAWARTGRRVVCVDSVPNPGTRWDDGEELIPGAIYTIVRAFISGGGHASVELTEVKRTDYSRRILGPNIGYHLRRFRPAVEDKTDNEIERRLFRKHRLESPVAMRLVD